MTSSAFDFLFPTPAAPPNLVAPSRSPGITPETVETLKKVLKDNYEHWHIFFNDRGFHKYVNFFLNYSVFDIELLSHAVHHAIALWALGADGAVIEAGYKIDSKYQRPTYSSPSPVTSENFKDHLGKAESVIVDFVRDSTHIFKDTGMPT